MEIESKTISLDEARQFAFRPVAADDQLFLFAVYCAGGLSRIVKPI